MEIGRVYVMCFRDEDEESLMNEEFLIGTDGLLWRLDEILQDGRHIFRSLQRELPLTTPCPGDQFVTQEEYAALQEQQQESESDEEEYEDKLCSRGGG